MLSGCFALHAWSATAAEAATLSDSHRGCIGIESVVSQSARSFRIGLDAGAFVAKHKEAAPL